MDTIRTTSQGSSAVKLKLGNWILLEEIGSGNTSKVFMGINSLTNEQVAVKIFFDTQLALTAMENEVAVLQALCHENIINLIESLQSVELISSKGETNTVSALVLELAGSGSFFELVQNRQYFSEKIVRSYFLQLLDALEHIHKNQIAHRDIKLENILLDHEYSIKIADFGYSCKMNSREPFDTVVGTAVYFAPEIHEGFPHYGDHADLFAAGVILFVAMAGHMPFEMASSTDEIYNMLLTRDYKSFWSFHERLVQESDETVKLSEDFKDLVTKMLDENPRNRLKIEEIRSHPWMQGEYYLRKQLAERIKSEMVRN